MLLGAQSAVRRSMYDAVPAVRRFARSGLGGSDQGQSCPKT